MGPSINSSVVDHRHYHFYSNKLECLADRVMDWKCPNFNHKWDFSQKCIILENIGDVD